MLVAIVIPCLNERATIPRTARSLGFGQEAGAAPPDTILILVDNGSVDGTPAALAAIQEAAGCKVVIIGHEPERGYVPPRATGVAIAARYAAQRGYGPADVLILQGDADTTYHPGYIEAFRRAAAAQPMALLEGVTQPPPRFVENHPGYQRLANVVDREMAPFLVDDALDVMVDDKVCAYTLANYGIWGGHRREYLANGQEIHAETSRLFLRGKATGAGHLRVPRATATPSRRKILRNPIRHFATAGFPRNDAWWRAWSRGYTGPRDIQAFDRNDALELLRPVIAMRKAHLLALMSALPMLVARTLPHKRAPDDAQLHPLVSALIGEVGANAGDMDITGLFDMVLDAAADWQQEL